MGLMTFKEVAVCFTEEEWVLLDPGQRALYWEVMAENYGMVASLAQELQPGMNVEGWQLAHEPQEREETRENETPAVQPGNERQYLSGAVLPRAKQTPVSGDKLEWEDQFLNFLKTAASPPLGIPCPQSSLVSDIREFWASLKGVMSHCLGHSREGIEHTLPGLGCETPGGPKHFVKVKEEVLSEEEESAGVEMPGRPDEKASRPLGNHKFSFSQQDPTNSFRMQEDGLLGNSNGALQSEQTFWQGTPEQMRHRRPSLEIARAECFRVPKVEETPEPWQNVNSFLESKPNLAVLCGEGAKNTPRRTFPENILSPEGRTGGPEDGIGLHRNALLPEDQTVPPEAEKVYTCSYCGKSFGKSLDLVAHERTHIGEKIYKCLHCEKRFSHWIDLQMHKKTHQREKPSECSKCGKSFIPSTHLVSHKQESGLSSSPNSEQGSWTSPKIQLPMEAQREGGGESHFFGDGQQQSADRSFIQALQTGEKPYKCLYCEKTSNCKANLVVHERTHTGEKPYACLDCGKSFNRKSTLVRHKRMHTGEKPYACAECGRCFSIRCNLINHQRIHTGEKPYSCSDCGQSFSRRLQLVIHQRTHTCETPYRCAQCGKCFTRRSSLLTHERTHMAKKRNTCADCGENFVQKGFL